MNNQGADAVLLFIVGILIASIAGAMLTTIKIEALKSEAASRGYMVECIGKEGYYWECEE